MGLTREDACKIIDDIRKDVYLLKQLKVQYNALAFTILSLEKKIEGLRQKLEGYYQQEIK